jgi:3-oxoadipate enol-lactonase
MSRPRVVLLHAFPLDCRMWADTKRALEAAGWQVSAPDLPGPEAEPTLAAWAERVLHAGDERIVPVGVSMGGYLAFELWRRARDRIAALVLVDTRAGSETAESRRGRDEMLELLDEVGVPAVWERLEGRLFAPGTPREVVERAREVALEQGTERLTAAVEAIRDREDSTGLLGEIDVPVLVVTGADDALVPPTESEAMAGALARSRLVSVPGAGHLPPLERPDDFARALLSFLDEVAA